MDSRQDGPHGVGGWLSLLVHGMLWLGPLMVIGRTSADFSTAEREYTGLAQMAEWSSFKAIEWIALLVFCAISIYGGLGLAKKRTPDAVSRAKLVLWFNYPISIIVTGMLIPVAMINGGGAVAAANIPSLIASLIAVGIWTAYLNRSKRVRNTYGLTNSASLEGIRQVTYESHSAAATGEHGMRASSPTPIVHQRGGSTAPIASAQRAVVDEDRIYTVIANELETGVADKGLWTRLFAECGGDEKQTKVHYIKQRADRLISAERSRLEQAASESAAEAERVEKLQPPPNDTQQMEEHEITFDGERYTYGEYKYDRLSDAISYAKLKKRSA